MKLLIPSLGNICVHSFIYDLFESKISTTSTKSIFVWHSVFPLCHINSDDTTHHLYVKTIAFRILKIILCLFGQMNPLIYLYCQFVYSTFGYTMRTTSCIIVPNTSRISLCLEEYLTKLVAPVAGVAASKL